MVEFTRILCPVDLSELSVRTLAYAGAIASWYEAHLTALHVVPSFTPMDVRTGLEPVSMVYPISRDEVLEQLRQAVVAAGLGLIRPWITGGNGNRWMPALLEKSNEIHGSLFRPSASNR